MAYAENVKRTLFQLSRCQQRQTLMYGGYRKPSYEALTAKLRRYADQSGVNVFLSAIDKVTEEDLKIGWAGKKRKEMMRKTGSTSIGRKAPKVSRRIVNHPAYLIGLHRRMNIEGIVPVVPFELIQVDHIESLVVIRNGKQGELHVRDRTGTVKVIPWVMREGLTDTVFYEAWNNLQCDTFGRFFTPSFIFRPLFRQPRMNRRPVTTP